MTPDKNIQGHYQERIENVLNFIQTHLGDSIQLKDLAEVGHFSAFHLHRIVSAYLGEPLATYVKRVRLEKAAQLLQYSDRSIAHIADDIGYQMVSSFSAAFKRHFGQSPRMYRQMQKITHQEKDLPNSSNHINFDFTPKIRTLSCCEVAFVRFIGPYGSEGMGQAWNTLFEFADRYQLLDGKRELIGMSYDDPSITNNDQCQYHACLRISKTIDPKGAVGVKTIPGGKYAVFTYRGSYDRFPIVYELIFKEWLLKSNYELRNLETLTRYITTPEDGSSHELLTEICLPIQ